MRTPARKAPTRRQLAMFRARLVAARRRVLGRLGQVDDDLRTIGDTPGSELEERSQAFSAADIFLKLGDDDFAAYSRIEGALHRMATGNYGFCGRCSSRLSIERLRANPAAALCSSCARRAEAPSPASASEPGLAEVVLPADLIALDDAEIAELVRQTFRDEVGTGLAHVRVVCRHGLVTLAGDVSSDELRDVALQIVEDEMGLTAVDRLRVSSIDDEGDGEPRAAGREDLAELGVDVSAADGISEDIFAVEEDGLVYNPPARPVAE